MKPPAPLDAVDCRIVELLRDNSRMSLKELGSRVHLTGQAVSNRLQRLEDLGVVQRYTVNVNCPVFGYSVHALLRGALSRSDLAFVRTLCTRDKCRVLHCYSCTGEKNIVLDAYFWDMEAMRAVAAAIGERGLSMEVQVVLDEQEGWEQG